MYLDFIWMKIFLLISQFLFGSRCCQLFDCFLCRVQYFHCIFHTCIIYLCFCIFDVLKLSGRKYNKTIVNLIPYLFLWYKKRYFLFITIEFESLILWPCTMERFILWNKTLCFFFSSVCSLSATDTQKSTAVATLKRIWATEGALDSMFILVLSFLHGSSANYQNMLP